MEILNWSSIKAQLDNETWQVLPDCVRRSVVLWTLESDVFTEETIYKIRIEAEGRGYALEDGYDEGAPNTTRVAEYFECEEVGEEVGE